jgi:class 3 adenylate cyclase
MHTGADMTSKNLAIMFTDMKGFTRRTSHQSRAENEAMLHRHQELVCPVAQEYSGTVVKSLGDSYLVTFESCTDAVLAAIEIQKGLADYNAECCREDAMELRIAISAGDVRVDQKDVFGEAVNIASRLEEITGANEICFTDSVFFSMNRSEVSYREIGLRRLEGIPYEVRVYQALVEQPQVEAPMASAPRKDDPVEQDLENAERKSLSFEDIMQAVMDDIYTVEQDLENAERESFSFGDIMQAVMDDICTVAKESRISVQIAPVRQILPPVRGFRMSLQKALLNFFRFALAGLSRSRGKLEVKYSGSIFRTIDVKSMQTFFDALSETQNLSEEMAPLAFRGTPALKLEITFNDTQSYREKSAFIKLWDQRFTTKEMGLDLSAYGFYRITQACGGTIYYEAFLGNSKTYKVKLPLEC